MYIFIIYIVGFISAIIFLFLASEWRRKRRLKKRNSTEKRSGKKRNSTEEWSEKKKSSRKKVKIDTYVKAATTIVLGHGLIMVTMSYVLAWFEKDAVVDVSTTLITEIVAPLCLYMGTNTIMNIFEKNKLSFSVPLDMELKETEKQNSSTDSEAVG